MNCTTFSSNEFLPRSQNMCESSDAKELVDRDEEKEEHEGGPW
jgi:hypothetical protein